MTQARLLIVDNLEESRYLLKVLLEGNGYQVTLASNGVEALRVAAESVPDLIVSDILMPEMDGFTLCRRCKADERLRDVPFIFYTATYTDPADEKLALSLGAARFMVKPTEPEAFVAMLRLVLAEHAAGRLPAPAEPIADESAYLREYSEALIRKLERKMQEVETANRALRAEIAERERVTAELRDSEARKTAMLEAALDCIITVDHEGKVVEWNSAAEKTFGYRRAQVLGKRMAELIIPPTLRPAHERGMARYLESGESRMLGRRIEIDGMRAGGSVFPVELTIAVIDGPAGPMFTAMVRDISARREAAAALRQNQQLLEALLANTTAVVCIKDLDGGYLLVNRRYEELVNVERGSLSGKTAADFFPEDLASRFERHERGVAETGVAQQREEQVPQVDGLHTYLSVTFPLLDDAGQVFAVGSMSTDVSELKLLEAQLRQAQKMEAVGQLAGGVAHDFNNLLTAILGYSELLLQDLPEPDERRVHVEQIRKAGTTAAGLTRQLLAFARKQVLQPLVVDLNAVVGEVEGLLRRLIGEEVELATMLDPALHRVFVDPTQIEQVLLNLAVNARDAMAEGGRLTIASANLKLERGDTTRYPPLLPGKYAVLTVADTGVGMEAEVAARIFEPFFTTKDRGEGTGLGLSTVYGIVEQSGGVIRVDTTPGSGSSFAVYLPSVMTEAEAERPSRPAVASLDGSETILVVEDDAGVRQLLMEALRLHGYDVLVASDGESGLELCSQHAGSIDLLLTDVVMPRLGGVELATRVAAERPGIKVLFMSGYPGDAATQRGVLDAEHVLLRKPFTPATLARRVRQVLDA